MRYKLKPGDEIEVDVDGETQVLRYLDKEDKGVLSIQGSEGPRLSFNFFSHDGWAALDVFRIDGFEARTLHFREKGQGRDDYDWTNNHALASIDFRDPDGDTIDQATIQPV